MLNLVSGICFAVSIGLFFHNKSRLLLRKSDFLKELLNFISYVKDSVRYTRTDVLTIKGVAAKKYCMLSFLKDNNYSNCFGYENEIKAFMSQIGRTDIKGQLELCERYYDQFDLIYKKEKEESIKNSKAYTALSLFGAAAVLVIFI